MLCSELFKSCSSSSVLTAESTMAAEITRLGERPQTEIMPLSKTSKLPRALQLCSCSVLLFD